MGLGSFIRMTVDGIPSRIGYFVMNQLDTNNMELRLNDGTIIINEETVHEILKVPIGGIDLSTVEPDSQRPLTFLTLLYVESTLCDIKDLPNVVPPLQRWSMDHLRQRLANGIKEGGLQMAKLKHLPAARPRQIRHPRKEDIPSTSATPCDIDSVKKDIVMPLNDKFAILMRTKIDAKTLIERAKEIFPEETLFERYEDELATLFNEERFRGSSGKKTTTVHTQEECGGKTSQHKDTSHTPLVQHGGRMRTPTKLDFDNAESLDAQSPLSPYWYSQTTLCLIDAQIIEQSGDQQEKVEQPTDNGKEVDLPIVPYIDEEIAPIRSLPEIPDIPVPSFNLGISQPLDSPDAPAKRNAHIKAADGQYKPVRRELKIGEQMKSPYVK
ncbi:hypothetical protein L6452_35045 [Arctium lappa]|uniref:Uncharacterized protein n=1 Tax=Arctium lappa TaxID=4217 RepID=A0ACB8YJU3_ARCLA|nr:hypothetical protein L6452_35045 [Arctium lappa]